MPNRLVERGELLGSGTKIVGGHYRVALEHALGLVADEAARDAAGQPSLLHPAGRTAAKVVRNLGAAVRPDGAHPLASVRITWPFAACRLNMNCPSLLFFSAYFGFGISATSA